MFKITKSLILMSLCIKLLTIFTFVAIAYWCSLNFLMANRHTWAPQADTAGNVSTNHKKKRNKETTEVYDPLNKSVHIGSLNKEVVAIREINASAMRESDSSFLEEVS